MKLDITDITGYALLAVGGLLWLLILSSPYILDWRW